MGIVTPTIIFEELVQVEMLEKMEINLSLFRICTFNLLHYTLQVQVRAGCFSLVPHRIQVLEGDF